MNGEGAISYTLMVPIFFRSIGSPSPRPRDHDLGCSARNGPPSVSSPTVIGAPYPFRCWFGVRWDKQGGKRAAGPGFRRMKTCKAQGQDRSRLPCGGGGTVQCWFSVRLA
jgi:hypothetical protein